MNRIVSRWDGETLQALKERWDAVLVLDAHAGAVEHDEVAETAFDLFQADEGHD